MGGKNIFNETEVSHFYYVSILKATRPIYFSLGEKVLARKPVDLASELVDDVRPAPKLTWAPKTKTQWGDRTQSSNLFLCMHA